MIGIADPSQAAAVSKAIDALFVNSQAETLTETEKAFQLGFVAMVTVPVPDRNRYAVEHSTV